MESDISRYAWVGPRVPILASMSHVDTAEADVPASSPDPAATGTYRLAEADHLLGISTQTSYRMRKDGTYPVPVLRHRNVQRIRKADLHAYLASHLPDDAA